MGTVSIEFDFYNPSSPKCRNCKHFSPEGGWLSGPCSKEDAPIKHRHREHNSKACSHLEVITHAEFARKINPNYEEARRVVIQHQQASASLLQRKLKIGYNAAIDLMHLLEGSGVIGPSRGAKAREILIKQT